MILIDANILLYARNEDSARYLRARSWLDEQLNGPTRVGLPWPSLLAFLRIATNRRIFPRPLSMDAAWRQVSEWLSCAAAWIPVPSERHAEVLERLLVLPGIRGDLVSDAHLAALAIEHGLVLCSSDGDFARFPNLRWQDPFVG